MVIGEKITDFVIFAYFTALIMFSWGPVRGNLEEVLSMNAKLTTCDTQQLFKWLVTNEYNRRSAND